MTNAFRKISVLMLACLLMAAGFAACSPKKNTAASRRYQAFITRYNIYFNGEQHYKETLADMERTYEDDFTALLPMHPAEAKANEEAPQPSGDFTRSIEKAQKAIQLRSIKKRPAKKSGKSSDPAYKAWMKREEYNPFLHNAWMMMGRSQYNNGDFLGAASTFFYTSRHFPWLPATVTEAKLWQARSYVALDWLFEAENILRRIKEEELENKTLRELYYFTQADFLIRSHDYEKAVPMLKEALRYADGPQRTRLTFLLGQIHQRLGQRSEAYAAFAKAGASSSAPYRTKFNARIKQSEVFEGSDIESEVKALRRMTRYDRNSEYLDQIYYAIGNLYLSRGDTARAIDNYELALENSKRAGIDKAIAGLTLGSLYFTRGRYDLAQRCYSEAVTVVPETYPDYSSIKRRSDVLDELAVYSQNVVLQDSLLRLSAMSPEEQQKVVERIIEELKKKEREEAEAAKREAYLAEQAANGTGLQQGSSQAPSTFTQNNDKSWYFYNTAARNAGKTEFQKRWGSRKLEDNWRRRNKASFSFDDFADSEGELPEGIEGEETADGDTPSKEEQERAADPHYPEYYLRQIPKTDAERATSNEIIQEGLYNMGVILKDKLEDFKASASEFNTLLKRYPDNIYRLEAYYNLYLMAVRSDNAADAERWRRLIVDEFPESAYGIAMRDPAYFDNLRKMEATQEELYAHTYDDYLNNRNNEVHAACERMKSEFPMSKILPKFMFLDALAYVTDNRPEEFTAALRELLEKYPETDLTPLASAYLRGMTQGRKLHAGTSNMRGMVWNMRLTNDSTRLDAEETPVEFDLSPDQPQMFVLLFPVDSVSANTLLYDVARFNFSSFVVRDFDLNMMNFGNLGMLTVKGFANQRELDHYRSMMNAEPGLKLPPGVLPVMISVKNFDALIRSGASFEQYFEATGQEPLAPVTDIIEPSGDEQSEDDPMENIPTQNNPPMEELPELETPEKETSPEDSADEPGVPDSSGSPVVIPDVEPTPESDTPAMPAPEKPAPAKPAPEKTVPAKPAPAKPAPDKPQPPLQPVPEGSEEEDDPIFDF